MKSYEMQIAEAVRDACIASGDFCCRIAERVDLAAIIVSVPKPKPVAWKDAHYGNLHHRPIGYCSIPLYAAPPAAEINAELLEALKAIIGDRPEDKYGYFAAQNALDDQKRQAARAAIARAEGEM